VIRFVRDWGPAVAWATLIFIVSGRSRVPVPLPGGTDKVAHFAAYVVLGAALAWAGARRKVPGWLLAVLGAAYGVSDELHQMLVPGRSPSVFEWMADAAGSAVGVALFLPLFMRLASGPRSRLP
jgi:VanZ family protein